MAVARSRASNHRCWHRRVDTATAQRESALRLHEAEARVSVRDRRGSGVGFAYSVGDRVERRHSRQAEGSASRAIDNREYDVTYVGAIWVSFCYALDYKLMKLKPHILLYIDILYIF